MNGLLGKRMVFGIVAILCVSAVTAFLKYDSDSYLKIVGIIVTAFMTAQTITDSIGK